MNHDPIIKASRESSRPFSPWLVMALGALTVAAQLGVIGMILWRAW